MKNCILIFLLLTKAPWTDGQEGEEPAEEGPTNPPCGGTFYDPKGTIESPNYPGNYFDHSDCVYRILTDMMIDVRFETFMLEDSNNCMYDSLEVMFDVGKDDGESKKYCGKGLEKIDGGHLTGKGPLILAFRSDESDSLEGFKFNFEFQLEGPDPCRSQPCQYGASCERMVGYYRCTCVEGYVGTNCEEDRDDCASYPCENGGECVDALNSYSCECINQFTGEICEIEPDPCESNPCQNGGLCVNRIPDYVCSCPRTFMGDMCEKEVPTPAPPPTTVPELPPEDEETSPQPSDDEDNESPTSGNQSDKETPSENETPTENETPPEKETPPSGGNGGVIAAVVIILLLALLIAAAVVWYWFKYHRKRENENDGGKQVTLINMKTRSDIGKRGKPTSKTTSINFLNSKGNKSPDSFMNKLKKMSEDIIMEEVTGEEETHKPQKNARQNRQKQRPSGYQPYQPPIKRLSIPVSPSEISTIMQPDSGLQGRPPWLGNDYPPHFGHPNEPLKISPEDAVKVLNYIKSDNGRNCDMQTALSMVKNNPPVAPCFYPNYPNPPIPTVFEPKPLPRAPPLISSPHALPNMPENDRQGENLELTPDEAAEVVKQLLEKSPTDHPVGPEEAMNIMRNLRDRRYQQNDPPPIREKTIILNKEEVANIYNRFNNRQKKPKGKQDIAQNHKPKESRDFRACTPIREESSDVCDEKSPRNDSEETTEDNHRRPPPKPKRFPYARTLDPEEKVNNWLKRAPRQRKAQRPTSPANSVATETHTLTRPLPARYTKNDFDSNRTGKNKMENDMSVMDYDDDDGKNSVTALRTIRQTRIKVPNTDRTLLPLTENKAKSLVEKLVRPPQRSNKNIVGPGLGVSRENAFVDGNR